MGNSLSLDQGGDSGVPPPPSCSPGHCRRPSFCSRLPHVPERAAPTHPPLAGDRRLCRGRTGHPMVALDEGGAASDEFHRRTPGGQRPADRRGRLPAEPAHRPGRPLAFDRTVDRIRRRGRSGRTRCRPLQSPRPRRGGNGRRVGYALGPLIVSRRLSDLPSLGVIGVAMALTALCYAPFALTRLPRHVDPEVGLSVVGLSLICTALAFVLFFALIAEVGPSRSTVITYCNPAVAILLGVVVLGEPFTAGLALGFPLILVGSVLATGRTDSPRREAGPRRGSIGSASRRPQANERLGRHEHLTGHNPESGRAGRPRSRPDPATTRARPGM